jgi:sec-independent protein translocase protein TatC
MALLDDIDERRLSLGEHLEELRKHVFKAVGWFIAAFALSLCIQEPLMRIATWPHVKTMDELKREVQSRTTRSHLGGDVANTVIDTLEDTEALEKDMRAVTRNATILKDQLDKDPRARFDALAKRRKDLADRLAALRAEQEKLLATGHPDAAAFEALEKQRSELSADLARYSTDVRQDVAPLSESGDVHVPRLELITLGYTEGFMGYLRVAMVFAFFVASPLVGREIWKFVAAGLHRNEKKYVRWFAPLTFIAFIIGASFGYFILIPAGLKFLAMYGDENMAGQFNLAAYLSLFLQFTLVVGLIFELPIIMNFIVLIGFFTPEKFAAFRRYWVLVAFVLGAILAPAGDPLSLCLCAAPLLVLYEVGIVTSRWLFGRKESAAVEPANVVD